MAQRAGAPPHHPSNAQRGRSDLQGVAPRKTWPTGSSWPSADPGSEPGPRPCQLGGTPASGAHNRGASHKGSIPRRAGHIPAECHSAPPTAPPCPPHTVPIVCPRHLEVPLASGPNTSHALPFPGGAHEPSTPLQVPGPSGQQKHRAFIWEPRTGHPGHARALDLDSFLSPECRPRAASRPAPTCTPVGQALPRERIPSYTPGADSGSTGACQGHPARPWQDGIQPGSVWIPAHVLSTPAGAAQRRRRRLGAAGREQGPRLRLGSSAFPHVHPGCRLDGLGGQLGSGGCPLGEGAPPSQPFCGFPFLPGLL